MHNTNLLASGGNLLLQCSSMNHWIAFIVVSSTVDGYNAVTSALSSNTSWSKISSLSRCATNTREYFRIVVCPSSFFTFSLYFEKKLSQTYIHMYIHIHILIQIFFEDFVFQQMVQFHHHHLASVWLLQVREYVYRCAAACFCIRLS